MTEPQEPTSDGAPDEPTSDGAPDELTDEDRAVLPPDTPLRRMLEDRRVRIAAIVGVPLILALCVAAAIFAQSIGIARSVVLEGPGFLAPGSSNALRVSYAEMDEFGLPHEIPFALVQLEVCPAATMPAPAPAPVPDTTPGSAAPAPAPAAPGCLLLGETPGGGRGKNVALTLQVPAVPAGRHFVQLRIDVRGKAVRYRFPVPFDAEARAEAAQRNNGRSPSLPVGGTGVAIDLVPLLGGVARGRTSTLILRAVGPEGEPYVGTLYLLAIGEGAEGLPPDVQTDALGLATFSLRSESFGYRLAVSNTPYPAMDPLEVEVGLLPSEVLDRAALLEVDFRPLVGPLQVAGTADAADDQPFLRAGGPLFASVLRDAGTPAPLFAELWEQGRLVRVGAGELPGGALSFAGLALPHGPVFVQVHRAGDPIDSVVGRQVWAGDAEGATPASVRGLIGAFAWPLEDQAWISAVRERVDGLDIAVLERLGRYLLGRRDPIWYPLQTLFDSRPEDQARAQHLREGVKTAMAWGIGGLALALVALALYVGFLAGQSVRRQRRLAAPVPDEAGNGRRVSVYDRAPWWIQHAVLLRMAVVFLMLAAALGGIAMLVWGMKQTYWSP